MTFLPLVNVGFLPVSVWDALDIAVVTYLLYQLTRLVRGSVASNILIGVITLYVLYFVVGQLGMQMLRAILSQFVSIGVIVIIIIFQPEIRRFLVVLGNNAMRRRTQIIARFFRLGDSRKFLTEDTLAQHGELLAAMLDMSRRKTGALLVISDNLALEPINTMGTRIDALLSQELLRTIFDKHTPLHDGAVLIEAGKIVAAGCVLPVTERIDLPQNVGLRHRAAIGFTERSQSPAFVVSEETGRISVARAGKLIRKLSESALDAELRSALGLTPERATPTTASAARG